MFPWPSVIFPLTAALARLPQSCYLTRSTSSNYPTLIMERIVPHRSTRRRRGGGNHPFVWVTVCNDFSLLLPSDLHVLYKCVCEVVCYCWALAGEPSLSHVMEAEMNGVITSDGFLCLSVHFVLIRCVSEALLLLLLPSFSRWTLPGCDSVVFFSFCWLRRERERPSIFQEKTKASHSSGWINSLTGTNLASWNVATVQSTKTTVRNPIWPGNPELCWCEKAELNSRSYLKLGRSCYLPIPYKECRGTRLWPDTEPAPLSECLSVHSCY